MTARQTLAPQITLSAALLAGGLVSESCLSDRTFPIRLAGLNGADLDYRDTSYYEHVIESGNRLDGRRAPPPPPFKDGPLAQPVADLRECVLVPGLTTTFQGARWSTNALGLRDSDCDIARPTGTTRAVLIGDSIGVGWGVDDGAGFERLLERALDARSVARSGPAVEILNLCVPGYAPGQRREHLKRLGWSLDPDLVLVQATAADVGWDERRLRALLPSGIGWGSSAYRDVLDSSGLGPSDGPEAVRAALKPRRLEILLGVYRSLVADAKARDVPIGWLLLPRVGRPLSGPDRRELLGLASEAGFDPIVDLSDAFDGLDPATLAVGRDDYHPNAIGHAILARRLEAALADRPGLPWSVPQVPSRPGSAGGVARR